ncbi:MAG TPA: argininosuccinate lyase, partial [Actinomycetota bacterium]|nr:argininosuccinate lyase [Actinomycetota bacterium]
MSDEGGMLWGGRFTSGPAEEMFRLTASIGIDIELLAADLAVTKAHARSLAAASLISVADVAAIDEACAAIGAEVERGDLGPGPHDEDVHSFVEAELTRRL